jgi:hypothetical protein
VLLGLFLECRRARQEIDMKTDQETLKAIHPLAWDVVQHLRHEGGVPDSDLEGTLDTIARHGVEGGIAGFIYDEDCTTFLRRSGVMEKAQMVMRDYADGIGEPLWRVAARTASLSCVSDRDIDSDQQLQIDGARLLAWTEATLTQFDYRWLAARLVWFVVVRVAYAFEDTDVDWRAGDPGDPEQAWDGYGDMEGGCHE